MKSRAKSVAPVRNRLMNGAAILALGGLIAKFLGAFYRVPLTNILGAQGMGMYQLVFPVYALFMTVATAGIPTALSRMVAEKRALGEETKKYLVCALCLLSAATAVAGILIAGLSGVIARWQGNTDTSVCYLVIAPAVFFVGVIAGLRGWFQGEMYMVPTAVSNILEQAVKLAVGIGLAIVFAPRGLKASVMGALTGITASEVVAALYLAITYAVRSRKAPSERLRLQRQEGAEMFRVAFPIALLGLMMPLGSFFDSMVIVNALKWGGVSTATATAQYGLYSGPVVSLVNMPVVMTVSLAIAVVPSVSLSRVEHDIKAIMTKSRLSLKLVYLIGVPVALFFIVFGRNMLSLMYPALSDAEIAVSAGLLSVSSLGIVMTGATQIYISLLQGLDRTYSAVKSLFAAIIVKLVLSIVLVRYWGIVGAAVASVAMSATSLVALNLIFSSLTGLRMEKNIAQILASGVIMALIGVVVREYVPTDIGVIAAGIAVSAFVYGWLTTLFGVFSEEEFLSLPFGARLVKIRRIVRFWEQN